MWGEWGQKVFRVEDGLTIMQMKNIPPLFFNILDTNRLIQRYFLWTGWAVVCNIPYFFAIEGITGTVIPFHLFAVPPIVSRHLHGGRISWWSMQKTFWPSTPLTWMRLWRSSPLRAGTVSPSSSCSMISSGQIVGLRIASLINLYFCCFHA